MPGTARGGRLTRRLVTARLDFGPATAAGCARVRLADPMKYALWIALSVSLAPLALSRVERGGFAQERAAELNPKWIAGDLERIDQLRAALAEPELDVAGLRKRLGSCDVREDRLIGFGARRLMIAVYGGYTTSWLHVLAAAPDERGLSRIAEMRCDQTGSAEHWTEASALLRPRWSASVRDIEHGFRVEFNNPSISRAVRAAAERALGAIDEVKVPEELKAAFETLSSPLVDLVLGNQIGDDGAPPPGRLEVLALVEAGRFDLIRAALRGMNPEGRAWAVWALLERAKHGPVLEPLDEKAIARLRDLPLELVVSEGCTILGLRLDEALKHIDS